MRRSVPSTLALLAALALAAGPASAEGTTAAHGGGHAGNGGHDTHGATGAEPPHIAAFMEASDRMHAAMEIEPSGARMSTSCRA